MTHVHVYISGSHEFIVRKGFRESCLDYARAAGLGELKSENYSEEVVPGAMLDEIMKRAAGGHVIVNSLAAFGTKPSAQRARVRQLQGMDATVHVLGLGPIDGFLNVLKAAWDAAAPLEQELLQLQADYDKHEQELNDRMARFEDKLISRLSETRGHQAVKAFYGANGGSHEEPVTDPLALQVRQLREAKGWSQDQLAAAAGVSKSQVHRIETTGKGNDIGKVISALEIDGWKPDTETKWITP